MTVPRTSNKPHCIYREQGNHRFSVKEGHCLEGNPPHLIPHNVYMALQKHTWVRTLTPEVPALENHVGTEAILPPIHRKKLMWRDSGMEWLSCPLTSHFKADLHNLFASRWILHPLVNKHCSLSSSNYVTVTKPGL